MPSISTKIVDVISSVVAERSSTAETLLYALEKQETNMLIDMCRYSGRPSCRNHLSVELREMPEEAIVARLFSANERF
jgi:hypothetical protein